MLPGYTGLAGASCSEEVQSVLTQVVAATQKKIVQNGATTLWVLYHNDEPNNIIYRRLLPPEKLFGHVKQYNSPILHDKPDRFFSHFLQYYLLLGLTQLFTVSLLAENEYRFRHLEGAIRRLDEQLAKLSSRVRTLRQEEIIEEIEVILLGSGAFDSLGRYG
jgi:F-type H+-transporting ATPase subunit gamma